MTSRERIAKTLRFEEPDRVPVDFGGMRSTGIAARAYARLCRHLGLDSSPPKVYDLMQMLAVVEEPVLARFGVDVVPLNWEQVCFGVPNRDWKPWEFGNGTPAGEALVPGGFSPTRTADGGWEVWSGGRPIARMPNQGFYFHPVPGEFTRPRPEDIKFPCHADQEFEFLRRESQRLYDGTDYAILGGLYGALFMMFFPDGFEEWLCDMVCDRGYVDAVLARVVDNTIEDVRKYHQAVGDRVFAVVFADDMGTQKGEFVRPELFAKVVAPHYKRLCQWIHANTPYKVFLHCCGSIYRLIETLIDCGIDILNPVQTSAANMDPARLKREFGGRIVFWGGGCDTQKTLPFGSAAEVEAEVEERIRIFAPGGGFVFTQVHNVQDGTPPENVVAMFDAVRRVGVYPISPG